MNKNVFECKGCNALYSCLKYFQEHRKKHAKDKGLTLYPCTYCPTVHNSEHESLLHSISHENESPHSCQVCQQVLGISEEEILGTRRSIGTATDFHVFNLLLDKPMISGENHDPTNSTKKFKNNDDNNRLIEEDGNGGFGHDDDDDNDNENDNDDNDDENDEDDDDDDDDDEDDDEEEDNDDDEDDDVDDEDDEENEVANPTAQPNVTNIIYVTNQTINHTTPQRNSLKPPRPSRSTGKGKGNRKARLTTDGDIRRKFSCCHCGKSFKTKSHLQRHILTHTGEKPYLCTRCDCRFNQSSSLRNHVIAIHTKEYPHTCNNCNKGFLMPAVLQKHLQTSECGKITNQVVEGL